MGGLLMGSNQDQLFSGVPHETRSIPEEDPSMSTAVKTLDIFNIERKSSAPVIANAGRRIQKGEVAGQHMRL